MFILDFLEALEPQSLSGSAKGICITIYNHTEL